MRSIRRVPLLVALLATCIATPAPAALIPPGPFFYMSFRGETDAPLTVTLEVLTTATAGGVPVSSGVYVVPLAGGMDPDVHGAAIIGALAADPNLTFGALVEVRPGWWRAPVFGIAGSRVGIRAVSSTMMPVPALPAYTQGPWLAAPAGIYNHDATSYAMDGNIFNALPIFGLLGTHIYADPPLASPPSPEALLEQARMSIEVEGLPATSPLGVIILALLVGMAGTYAVVRSRNSTIADSLKLQG